MRTITTVRMTWRAWGVAGLGLFGAGNAIAATTEVAAVGSQPLGDERDLLLRLETICGSLISTSSDSPVAYRYELDVCDVVVDGSRGVLHVAVLADRDTSTEVSDDLVRERQLADIELLTAFGFDAEEFGTATTKKFASQMRDEETGVVAGPVVLGTKTYVPRSLSGVPVLGNRAVVTRDTAGTVTRITAGWPTLDPVTLVEVSDTENIDLEEAVRFSARPVVATRTVVILDRAVDGVVSGARLCTEVTELRNGVEGSTVPAALYIMDGATFDPRASEGI